MHLTLAGINERLWVAGVGMGALVAVWGIVRRGRLDRAAGRARRIQAEMEGYAKLDARMPGVGDVRGLAARVCRVVAEVSEFRQVAMMARDADGRLFVACNLGIEEEQVEALTLWGSQVAGIWPRGVAPERVPLEGVAPGGVGAGGVGAGGVEAAVRSFGLGKVFVIPLWSTGGRMLGALVVAGKVTELSALEGLAGKLARTMENAALAERLMQAEKLAGLGQLAGGVAHALNNPLTAVLGFAELIAETTDEARVREDAVTIVREALRMRETVQSLLDLWRPASPIEEQVSLTALVRELASDCANKLGSRGVQLVVETGVGDALVQGCRHRLRQVMEHLLNNAAQAVAVGEADLEEGHVIRVTVQEEERGVQVIVSDTGPGFREPSRVFDPFYTTRDVGEGTGLGLSLCYGVVREHGGEISAFNLHPRGGAVVMELRKGSRS